MGYSCGWWHKTVKAFYWLAELIWLFFSSLNSVHGRRLKKKNQENHLIKLLNFHTTSEFLSVLQCVAHSVLHLATVFLPAKMKNKPKFLPYLHMLLVKYRALILCEWEDRSDVFLTLVYVLKLCWEKIAGQWILQGEEKGKGDEWYICIKLKKKKKNTIEGNSFDACWRRVACLCIMPSSFNSAMRALRFHLLV